MYRVRCGEVKVWAEDAWSASFVICVVNDEVMRDESFELKDL